jgi:adenylyltransferase/sulfurtransferase
MFNAISPQQLQTILPSVQLLDVREAYEQQICSIGGLLIPLAELPARLTELDPKQHTVVYCRSGGRSAKACELLVQAGFAQVSNLDGGILRWQAEIDNSLARY